MSDLDELEQPLAIPRLGTDGTYDDPGEDWDGTETRTALSAGAEAAGLLPNTFLCGQLVNDQCGRLGDGLASIMDVAAVNWTEPRIAFENYPIFSGAGNGLFGGPKVLPVSQHSTVQRRDWLGLLTESGLDASRDGYRWTNFGDMGFSGAPGGAAPALGHGGLAAGASDSVMWIVAFADETNTFKFRASGDLAVSFDPVGQLPAGAEGDETHVMGYFGDRAFWCARSQLYYRTAAELVAGATTDWTRIITSGFWTGAPPSSPRCFATSPTECAIGIFGGPSVIRSADGVTWAAAGSGLSNAAIVDLHWCAARSIWIATTSAGDLYTAPAGMSAWTALSTYPPDIARTGSLGRSVFALGGAWLYVTRDLENWARLSPEATPGNVNDWEFILPFNGAVWIAHQSPDAGVTGDETLESAQSLVLPSALRKVHAF